MVSENRDDDGVNKDRPARWKGKGRTVRGIGLVEKSSSYAPPGSRGAPRAAKEQRKFFANSRLPLF